MQVTFKGEPLEVKGTQPKVGDKAPEIGRASCRERV